MLREVIDRFRSCGVIALPAVAGCGPNASRAAGQVACRVWSRDGAAAAPLALRRHRTGLAYRVNPRAGWSQVRIGTEPS